MHIGFWTPVQEGADFLAKRLKDKLSETWKTLGNQPERQESEASHAQPDAGVKASGGGGGQLLRLRSPSRSRHSHRRLLR